MHEGLWETLVKLDPGIVAQNANCDYFENSGVFTITLLNRMYEVSPKKRIIQRDDPSAKQPDFMEQLCILAYLINVKDTPVDGKLVAAEKLQGGQFFFRGPHELPTTKLQEVFGLTPERLFEASQQLNARQCEYGDASIEVFVLPKLPLVFVIWAGDDEFDARASILFDKSATDQIPLDAVLAAVTLTADTIIKAAS